MISAQSPSKMNLACVDSRFPLLSRRFSRRIRDAFPPDRIACDDPVGADSSVHFRRSIAFSLVHCGHVAAQHTRVRDSPTIRSTTVFDQNVLRRAMPCMWNDHIVVSHGTRSITVGAQVEYRRNVASGVSGDCRSLGSYLGNSRSVALVAAERLVGRRAGDRHLVGHAQRLGCTSLDRIRLNCPPPLDQMPKKMDVSKASRVSSLRHGRS